MEQSLVFDSDAKHSVRCSQTFTTKKKETGWTPHDIGLFLLLQ